MSFFFIIIMLIITIVAYYKHLNGEDISYLLIVLLAAESFWSLCLCMQYIITGFSTNMAGTF